MELFDSMDSSLAEFLGVNEYELLSKQAKVSNQKVFYSSRQATSLHNSDCFILGIQNELTTIKATRMHLLSSILTFRLWGILSEILDYLLITRSVPNIFQIQ